MLAYVFTTIDTGRADGSSHFHGNLTISPLVSTYFLLGTLGAGASVVNQLGLFVSLGTLINNLLAYGERPAICL